VYDRDRHLKQDKVLGKVAIKREDLHMYHNRDHWFPILPVDADSEVQVKCITLLMVSYYTVCSVVYYDAAAAKQCRIFLMQIKYHSIKAIKST
jgi:hypothetical protein